ncbi:MAG: hypothetical protein GWP18_04080 [Proteobacteria bacterium]|nr:hypothetical protein [Pseudomonadota bacterium]
MLTDNAPNVLSYARTLDHEISFVAINFTESTQRYVFPCRVEQILTTHEARSTPFGEVILVPNEAIVVKPAEIPS